ncbi:class I SAM-dependent methyltransferase [Actinospica robiniae]|uniref:class I SAM-dependent methyltransferase n=1 Tax=Actinospica robiniae TaxID=304901 RepID=UPI0004129612|nr:class I SAM-dependent methyltransferase [Actinospica robiniae]
MEDRAQDRSSRITRAFDELAPDYDHGHHDAVARALIDFMRPATSGAAADVACGSGAVAVALAAARDADASPVLAIDLSPAMIESGRERAEHAGVADRIEWRVSEAVPLPVPAASLESICCASSLHFLGAGALADWRRALRPGGQVGFTMPAASGFRAGGVFAELVADLPLPDSVDAASRIAIDAGFVSARAEALRLGRRTVFLVTAFMTR